MGHGGTRLFLARMQADKVVPSRPSTATATGAFLVDPVKLTVSYDLTYYGLEYGPAQSIGLYNFGAGKNGSLVHTICGASDRACPQLPSANVIGVWDGKGNVKVDSHLLSEFASARIYVEIVGGDGKREIRGQLEPNGSMVLVKNFVAHLAGMPSSQSRGTGTAVLSEVHYSDGLVSVFYQATVADTNGTPTKAALVGVPDADTAVPSNRLAKVAPLPKMKVLPSKATPAGGTLTGTYQVDSDKDDGPTATKLLSIGTREVGIVVSTSKFPDGEIYGVFKPVH
jgi:hypothetical protein